MDNREVKKAVMALTADARPIMPFNNRPEKEKEEKEKNRKGKGRSGGIIMESSHMYKIIWKKGKKFLDSRLRSS